jgi:hypothetical protein
MGVVILSGTVQHQEGLLRSGDELLTSDYETYYVLKWNPTTRTVYVLPAPSAAKDVTVTLRRPFQSSVPITSDILDKIPEEELALQLVRRTTGISGSVTSFEDYGGTAPGTVRANLDGAHGLVESAWLKITGSDHYDGVHLVTPINTTSVYFTATWVDDSAGNWALEGSGPDLLTTASSRSVYSNSGENFVDLGVVPGDNLLVLSGPDSLVDVGLGRGIFPIACVNPTGLDPTELELTNALTSTQVAPGVLYAIERKMSHEG